METKESYKKDIINLRPKLICDVDRTNNVLRIVYTGIPAEFFHTLVNRTALNQDMSPYMLPFIEAMKEQSRGSK